MPFLPNGHDVVLTGIGHTGSFFAEQADAGTHLINTFFETGEVDASHYQPQAPDFTPTRTFGGIAKAIVSTMLGLGALSLSSLGVIALCVHRRGSLEPMASAVVRSVYSVVLGLGGWSLAALVALVTMPSVRITSELLVVVSVAMPIGIAIYWAWAHRDSPASTRATGFAAATGGALIGGWLGFNATDGLASLVTAIVGASLGANLDLIVLDITMARLGRRPAAPSLGVEPAPNSAII